jgi:hypothetical protein
MINTWNEDETQLGDATQGRRDGRNEIEDRELTKNVTPLRDSQHARSAQVSCWSVLCWKQKKKNPKSVSPVDMSWVGREEEIKKKREYIRRTARMTAISAAVSALKCIQPCLFAGLLLQLRHRNGWRQHLAQRMMWLVWWGGVLSSHWALGLDRDRSCHRGIHLRAPGGWVEAVGVLWLPTMEEWGREEEGWRKRKRCICRCCDVIKTNHISRTRATSAIFLTCEIYGTCRGLGKKKVGFHAKAISALTCIAIESRNFL